jgi:hypothetical protein
VRASYLARCPRPSRPIDAAARPLCFQNKRRADRQTLKPTLHVERRFSRKIGICMREFEKMVHGARHRFSLDSWGRKRALDAHRPVCVCKCLVTTKIDTENQCHIAENACVSERARDTERFSFTPSPEFGCIGSWRRAKAVSLKTEMAKSSSRTTALLWKISLERREAIFVARGVLCCNMCSKWAIEPCAWVKLV